MTRLHIHISVQDLDTSIQFYSTLFGTPPTVTKSDYAKWMLEDPKVNFAISSGHAAVGIEHLGIQTETGEELADITQRLKRAEQQTFEEENTTCCYTQSDKTWVADPSGVRWENFLTHGEATTYGVDASLQAEPVTPAAPQARCC